MTLVVMQPYWFPYLGYFQLLHAADRFVVYDDVAYIKGGWINRNRLLLQGEPAYFTVPLAGASSFRPIDETAVVVGGPWREKMLRTFREAYGKAPHFAAVYALLESVLADPAPTIGGLATASLRAVAAYLDIQTPIIASSRPYGNAALHGSERLIDLCRREGADTYLNAIGGRALYDPAAFANHGIALKFLQPVLPVYGQFGRPFVPGLSILDVLMFNSAELVRSFLKAGELV